ncbi:MAG: type II secretion system F family protein [Geminicoccaceae bacterium]
MLTQLLAADAMPMILVFAGVAIALWLMLAQFDPAAAKAAKMQKRMERIASPEKIGPADEEQALKSLRRNDRTGAFSNRISRILPSARLLRNRMDRANVPLSIAGYVLICVVVWLGASAGLLLAAGFAPLTSAILGFVIGAGLPHLVIGKMIKRRAVKFTAQLPEALDLIVRSLRSGLPATEAIQVIGQEMQEPVASQFADIGAQVQIGVSIDEALWATSDRLQIQEFKYFAISLAIQQETGGNLAEILENLSAIIRKREQLKLKVKALSSEARASALIIGSLPFIMGIILYIVDPGYISQFWIDPRGPILLGIGGASMLTGILVMAKLIKFEA